ncbi:MAG: hypothetical protein ACYTBZ_00905 [Planctomycetota bacterium]|jgi:hypothetical protein
MPPKNFSLHHCRWALCLGHFFILLPLITLAQEKTNVPPSIDLDNALVVAQAGDVATIEEPQENSTEIKIVQALDQPMDLKVSDMPIRELIQQLADKTGLPIHIEPGALNLMPYGSRTTLSATIESQPLKESLTALLLPIGLTFEVQPDRLLIKPTKHLARIVNRATWKELETLEMLYQLPWSEELFNSLGFQFQDAPAADLETNRETLRRLANAVGEGTAAEVLELACDQYGWAWYPSGEFISIVTKTRLVEHQLQKRVSLKYVHKTLSEALLDLVKRAGILLRMDPGVMASLPPQTAERFTLSIENASIRQALEIVSGETGLGYFIEPDGIRLTTSSFALPSASANGTNSSDADATARATVAALRTNSIVGQITMPSEDGTSFSFFVRENDLPPEVNEMRKAKIRNAVNLIRKSLLSEQRQD